MSQSSISSAISKDLFELASSTDSQRDLAEKYKAILDSIMSSEKGEVAEGLKAVIRAVVSENVNLVISRKLLTEIGTQLLTMETTTSKNVAHYALDIIQPRAISFEDQVGMLRQHLATIYEKEENWQQAAEMLIGIPLETGQKQYTVQYKLETYLKVARLYLEVEDDVQSEAYINRAAQLVPQTKEETILTLFKACQARLLDFKRKFIEAASKFNEMSYKTILHENERMTALKNAMICTILAEAGQQRCRMLATLYKDERCQQLPAFTILEKMYLGRLIKSADLKDFESLLQTHHKAITSDGSTILQYSCVQHNLLAASKLYNNITLDGLGALLEVSPENAERIARTMITEKRLEGRIDQVDSLVLFHKSKILEAWDEQIQSICGMVNDIIDKIAAAEPAFLTNVHEHQMR